MAPVTTIVGKKMKLMKPWEENVIRKNFLRAIPVNNKIFGEAAATLNFTRKFCRCDVNHIYDNVTESCVCLQFFLFFALVLSPVNHLYIIS